ncbi:MAG: hypothetical protein HRU01_27295 [Myxococcales bacterium]|nr:hypothetical protein [Myxococcales bacterium]
MARGRSSIKLLKQFSQFARENRMYWLIPLMIVLGVAALLVVAGQTAAPLIYTLF